MPEIDLADMSAELARLRETVRRLSDREEIFDCLHRYNRGLDRLDPDCVMSAYFSDADDHHGPFRGTPAEFTSWVMEHMLQWDSSLHMLDLNNLTIEGDSADSECYVIFTQRLADHSHERSDPLRQLRSDVACWSTMQRAPLAIRIRRA